MVSGKVGFGTTALAKLLPLALVIPLALRLQTIFPIIHLNFDVEQFAYALALGVTVVISFVEFKIAQGENKGADSINAGSMLAVITSIVGLLLLIYVLAIDYNYADEFTNDIISVYFFFAIFLISVQAAREIGVGRKIAKSQSIFG